jgi:hypothetical protein
MRWIEAKRSAGLVVSERSGPAAESGRDDVGRNCLGVSDVSGWSGAFGWPGQSRDPGTVSSPRGARYVVAIVDNIQNRA